ncbi:MAG TPA: alpha/beta hydrolase [Candidatus Saccharimonadales bacterium]|nr:alpha/beta hydrolase [Candidatus Saccharimonadales bacterium]
MKNQINIFGSTVKYWVFNADKPKTLVMIHGFRGTHHGLQLIIDRLPDFKIIIPDLPGFGESTPLKNKPHTINGYCDFLKEFIKRVAPEQPFLLGHSFGSIIVSHFAAKNPNAISKLILINAIAEPPLKGPQKVATKIAVLYYWLGQKLPQKMGEKMLRSKIVIFGASLLMTTTKDKALRKFIHENHLKYFSTFQDRDTLREAFEASTKNTASDKADVIKVPTLMIAGELDKIAPLRSQHNLVKIIPDAQLVVFKAGHLIHHEAPTEAASSIRNFLT